MTTEVEIEDVYTKMQKFSIDLASESSILAVAGVMMAQALTVYKTVLSPEEFEMICSSIYESRNKVKKLTGPTLQ